MYGCWGACIVARGHAWLPFAWLWGGHVWFGGCAWLQGACMVAGGEGACMGYDEIYREILIKTQLKNNCQSLVGKVAKLSSGNSIIFTAW